MVHTAIGFAKANHRLATLACTASIGPGSTNMITGAAAATINRLPVLLFPSDYYATRHQGPVLQQLEHPVSADVSVNDCFRPVSRFFDRITRPEQILTALPEAMRVLTDPAETGAVTIALPQDIQAHAYDYPAHFFRERRWRVERRPPDRERIREAVALLAAAERPVMIAGGGVHYSEAWSELAGLRRGARHSRSARRSPARARSRKSRRSPWAASDSRERERQPQIIAAADLVISVGTRLTDFATGSQSASAIPTCGSSPSTSARTTPSSKAPCRSWPTRSWRSRPCVEAALAAGIKPRDGLPGRGQPRPEATGRPRCGPRFTPSARARR